MISLPLRSFFYGLLLPYTHSIFFFLSFFFFFFFFSFFFLSRFLVFFFPRFFCSKISKFQINIANQSGSFFFFFFFFSSKISKLQINIANQSGTHTMPKPAKFQPPMHSDNVFHRRVERPSIAGIGSVPKVVLKTKKAFCRVLVIAVDFLKVKGEVEKVSNWQEQYFGFIIIISFVY